MIISEIKKIKTTDEGAKNSGGKRAGLVPATGNYRYTPGVPAPDCYLFY